MVEGIESLISRTIQYVSDQNGVYKREEVRQFIRTELISQDEPTMNSFLALLLDKFKNVAAFYENTPFWTNIHQRYENTSNIVQYVIRKNIILFLTDLVEIDPDINFKEVSRDLSIYYEFLGLAQNKSEADIKKVILDFLVKQSDRDLLPYIEKCFNVPTANELASVTDTITQNTHFKEEILDWILLNANAIVGKFPSKERENVARHLWTGLHKLVEHQHDLGGVLVERLIDADPSLSEILRNAITMSGTLPERSSGVCEKLIDYLISDSVTIDLKNLISKILLDIIRAKVEIHKDAADVFAIIVDKAKYVSGVQKEPLRDLLNLILKVEVKTKEEWRTTVELILGKLDMGTHLALQKAYIETELQKRGFTAELYDFTGSFDSFDTNSRSTIGQLRPVYESLIKKLVIQIGGSPTNNTSNNLRELEINGILQETPTNTQDQHLELNFSYKIYGLLSYYGVHPGPIADELIFTIFIETISWIYLLLKRSE
jgi:hypothetical protein